jgi:antitoxin (DNA-binding transcriptional repressor) of toxin-antitoxin stability system
MTTVNMLEAKTNLSRLVEAIESGAEEEIIIARNGRPAARLVRMSAAPVWQRIGAAKGQYSTPDPDPEIEAKAAAAFLGQDT